MRCSIQIATLIGFRPGITIPKGVLFCKALARVSFYRKGSLLIYIMFLILVFQILRAIRQNRSIRGWPRSWSWSSTSSSFTFFVVFWFAVTSVAGLLNRLILDPTTLLERGISVVCRATLLSPHGSVSLCPAFWTMPWLLLLEHQRWCPWANWTPATHRVPPCSPRN